MCNRVPYRVDGELGRFEFFTHSCADAKVSFDSSKDTFPVLKGKERYRTRCFREITHFAGCTDSSFRITTHRLNRGRRQVQATPVKFVQEGAEREGRQISEQLREQSAEILSRNGFKPDGVPTDDEFEFPASARLCGSDEVQAALERVVVDAPAGITLADLSNNVLGYEDGDDVVNISVDDVLTKKQKSERRSTNLEEKKRIYNNVIHIQNEAGRYVFNTPKLSTSLPILLAILLKNRLLNKPLRFFTDGERSLKTNIFRFFAWHTNVHLILDWYHLSEKCRQCVSLTMKGNKKEKREIVQHLRSFLWYGLIDHAIDHIRSFDDKRFKLLSDREYLIGYLERNREHIPCYAARKELELKNGSQMGEKSNDILIADRQKHNGMSWSPSGSETLGCLTAVKFNGEMDHWFKEGTLSMLLRQVEHEAAA